MLMVTTWLMMTTSRDATPYQVNQEDATQWGLLNSRGPKVNKYYTNDPDYGDVK